MEELDLLKKAWQEKDQTFEEVSEKQIYKMLHKNSSSSVKWILVISIIELAVWTLVSIVYNVDESIKKMHAENIMVYLKALTYINYAVILWFIYCFYKNYQKISVTTSTKQLMQDILKTRRTVQNYVWYNLSMIVISFILGFIVAFMYNPDLEIIKSKITNDHNNNVLLKVIGLLALFTVLFVGLFWLFYRLLYGILLRRLKRNYNELKKIDL
jgi:uncharacterized BrkB/YihY/UPF0761 family membrane protein